MGAKSPVPRGFWCEVCLKYSKILRKFLSIIQLALSFPKSQWHNCVSCMCVTLNPLNLQTWGASQLLLDSAKRAPLKPPGRKKKASDYIMMGGDMFCECDGRLSWWHWTRQSFSQSFLAGFKPGKLCLQLDVNECKQTIANHSFKFFQSKPALKSTNKSSFSWGCRVWRDQWKSTTNVTWFQWIVGWQKVFKRVNEFDRKCSYCCCYVAFSKSAARLALWCYFELHANWCTAKYGDFSSLSLPA